MRYNSGDSFISFCMNEKETIVYFYCRKETQNRKTKEREKKGRETGKASLWKRLWEILQPWKFSRGRETAYENLCKRMEQGEEMVSFRKRSCYGIRYVSCELPFSLGTIQKEAEKGCEKKEQDIFTHQETLDVIGGIKKRLMRELEETTKIEEEEERDIDFDREKKSARHKLIYVNYEINLQRKLGISSEGCPCSFYVQYYKNHIKDGILLVKDGEMAEDFLRAVYENLNGLLVISEEHQRWEELAQEVYQQSGLILQYDSELNWHRKTWEGHYLFDFAYTTDEKKMHIRELPKGVIYVDCMPSYEKQRVIQGKRKDITYIPCPKCLDTCRRCEV